MAKQFVFFKKSVLSLALLWSSHLTADPGPQIEHRFNYDIEMVAFWPFHCEATLMKKMKTVFDSKVFIETGTLGGVTAALAGSYFQEVHTIEIAKIHYEAAKSRNRSSHVFFHLGSSPQLLPKIISSTPNKRLFWLDAHYSGGNTDTMRNTRGDPISPLFEEVRIITEKNAEGSVILIDDISGYLCAGKDIYTDPCQDIEKYSYPPLHRIRDLIKKQSPYAEFYVLGDLAIAYDSRSYRPSISPLVKACTESRMFDYFSPSDDTERSVLQAEYAITTSTAVNENERIHYLSSFCGCRDYRLWRALLNLGQRNYPQAILDFQYVLDQGIKHWRIYFYLGYAQIKAKQFNKAKGTLQMIKDDYLKNFDLLDSFYHLKSDPNFTNV